MGDPQHSTGPTFKLKQVTATMKKRRRRRRNAREKGKDKRESKRESERFRDKVNLQSEIERVGEKAKAKATRLEEGKWGRSVRKREILREKAKGCERKRKRKSIPTGRRRLLKKKWEGAFWVVLSSGG